MRKVATLQEIKSYWTIDDLMDANERFDIVDDVEYLQVKEMRISAELRRRAKSRGHVLTP